MSVLPSDIVVYGSANMPGADSATVGGAVDFTKRCAWYDLSANDTIDAVSSSSSDTATKVQVLARSTSGVVVTSAAATLAGQKTTVFMGETLRGKLLNAWGWGTMGLYTTYAGIGLMIAALGVLGAVVFELLIAVRKPESFKVNVGQKVTA